MSHPVYDNGLKCSYCGKHDDLRWQEHVQQRLIDQQACHTCGFWLDHAERDADGDKNRYVITPDWEHYIIGLEDAVGFRGFGGHTFTVRWEDPKRAPTVTTNLWAQGKVPEHMRGRFTINARGLG